jgi:hypothetical protein
VPLFLYADDIKILVVEKEEEELQHTVAFVMQQLEIWYRHNDLIVNSEKKTCLLSSKSHQNRLPCRTRIIFNGNEIAYQFRIKIFRSIYYREFSFACSNPFFMCKFE